jgi:MOSC domain-containing protein YiiM
MPNVVLAGRGYPCVLMATLLSVNVGHMAASRHTDTGITGIDKRPSAEPVALRDPGPGTGRSGAAGDAIGDPRSHGGTDQAVYAYAREDLDHWQAELGRPLTNGVFGENLTTALLDVNGALVGERWQVGDACVLEVTSPRIPCRTFAGWLEEQLWVKRFTQRGTPGAYLRVISPGSVTAGDAITVLHQPSHGITIALMFRALTTDKALQPRLAAAGDALPESLRRQLVP